MTDSKKTVKTKSTLLGTLLVAGATAVVTAIAVRNADKINAGFKSLGQHVADGTLTFPPAKGMNGKERHAPAPAGH